MISFATGLFQSTRFVDKSALLSNKVHLKVAIPIKVQRTDILTTALLQKLWSGGSKSHACSVLDSKAQYAVWKVTFLFGIFLDLEHNNTTLIF